MTVGKRIKEYMELTGKRQSDIVNACKPFCDAEGAKITKQMLHDYINEAYEPKQTRLGILSRAMGVSVGWLLGYDVPMERTADEIADAAVASADDPRLAKAIEQLVSLPEDKRDVVYAMIDALSRN